MSEMMRVLRGAGAASDPHATRALRAFAAITLCTGFVLAIFGATFLSMVDIWRRSDTFAHGFLVVPAFLYLTWQKKALLAGAPIRPFWPGLIAIAGAGFLWLLAELAGALAPAQFAVIALVPAAVLTGFGVQWLRILAFPLAFLFFAVPFGEIFVPTLIDWTADFTVAALRMTGMPVYREGAQFVLPSGNWSVVDGCSGIRYLIASFVTGSLYAWLMYRSARRRFVFVAASIGVPLVANWLRAYLIVMIGHMSNNQLATGVDHLIYGWVFFGVVILVLFAIGARWREEPADEDIAHTTTIAGDRLVIGPGTGAALIAVALAATVWPAAKFALDNAPGHEAAQALAVQASAQWASADRFTAWQAAARGPVAQLTGYFANDGRLAGLQVALYRNQHQGSELVTSGNRLVAADNTSNWHVTAQRTGEIEIGGRVIGYRETLLRADRLIAVRQWYWLDDDTTISDVRAKVSLAFDRLFMRSDASAWVLAFTPVENGLDEGTAVLDAFMRDRVPALQTGLEAWAR
jgi:exosortase A